MSNTELKVFETSKNLNRQLSDLKLFKHRNQIRSRSGLIGRYLSLLEMQNKINKKLATNALFCQDSTNVDHVLTIESRLIFNFHVGNVRW